MNIALIRDKVSEGDYHWRQHAIECSIERDIAETEGLNFSHAMPDVSLGHGRKINYRRPADRR
jgi:hypothetical protein